MEIDSNFSLLLESLKVADPWTPPQTWESIPSQSGLDRKPESGRHDSKDTIYDLSVMSEANLVRLVINGLQGVRSAIVVMEKLSVEFCSIPADRTSHRVPNLWSRSSSTNALGKMLKSITHSGFVFLFLQQFVNYYNFQHLNTTGRNGDKDSGVENQKNHMSVEDLLTPEAKNIHYQKEMKLHPPFSIVNHAFSVAVRKVLEGYLSALNTLLSSVRLRRSVTDAEALRHETDGGSILTSVSHSEITVLEVYLHTEELRIHIDVLGNICLSKVAEFTSFNESLTDTIFEFHKFPRGADLLTYLYVLLRDADPGHHALLKYLFVHSCEPYYGFIKSWIYHASIDDPYEEFFVVYRDISPPSNDTIGSAGDSSLASIKKVEARWRDCTSVPCFLKDICHPLLRAGQQLEVLVKLLNLCSSVVLEEHVPCSSAWVEDILPYWVSSPSNLAPLLNPLTFSREGIKVLIHKRETTYRLMLEKLQIFFTKLYDKYHGVDQTVIPPGVPSLHGNIIANYPRYLVSEWDLNLSSTFDIEGANHMTVSLNDTAASSTVSSFEMESSHASESCSSCSYEEESEPEGISEQSDSSYHASQLLLSNLLQKYCPSKSNLLNSETKKKNSAHSFHDNCESGLVIPLDHQYRSNEKVDQMSASFNSVVVECIKKPETPDEGYQSGTCWPLGGILENPFYADMNKVPNQLSFKEHSLQKADGNTQTLEGEELNYGGTLVPCDLELDAARKTQFMKEPTGNLPSCNHLSWNSFKRYNLNINPKLTKTDWFCTVRDLRDSNSIGNDGPCFRYFNFSSVADPCKAYSERTVACNSKGSEVETSNSVGSGVPAITSEDSGDSDRDKMATNQSGLSAVCSSRETRETNLRSKVLPSSVSGGAGWETLLNYSGDVPVRNGNTLHDSAETFAIPLDVVIDKCILQEILIQYKYVSNFTIKLLKDCFDLHEHLFSLRRYHFMELADWADSFIVSLHNQKWSLIETNQNIAKIQGLLDLALQRSSCERDPYRKRLFFYLRDQNQIQQPTSATGLHAFQAMILGYRVDWPVSIVITQEALTIYAEIFSYLIQVRLAVFSLTDVWHHLKAIMHSTKHGGQMGSHEMKDFTTLMKIRHRINHFVATLQQYVHSQLSDVSWCQFQHSLKHQVKDIFDLESLHMSYLADALHICFLSADTKPTAIIIKNILQCALDFRLCFPARCSDFMSGGKDPLDLQSRINFSQVFAIKSMFEQNLKDLYSLYLKSPKHGEFSLCRFWGYLNYNDYYAINITKAMGYSYH